MSSILTNTSAMTALQTLKSVNMGLNKTQDEIATGKMVASAKDNAAVWAISKVMESDVMGFKGISDALNIGESTVAVARTAAETITDLLNKVKAKIVAAQGENVDRTKLQTDVEALRNQITSVVDAAQFNGLNLVNGSVETTNSNTGTPLGVNVLSSLNRDSDGNVTAGYIAVDAQNLSTTAGLALVDDTYTGTAANFGTTPTTVTAGVITLDESGGTEDAITLDTFDFFDNTGAAGATIAVASDTAGLDLTDSAALVEGDLMSLRIGSKEGTYVVKIGDNADAIVSGLKNSLVAAGVDVDNYSLDISTSGALTITNLTNAAIEVEFDATRGTGGLTDLLTMDVSDATGAAEALADIETMIDTAIDAAAEFGSVQTRIGIQASFVSKLTDALNTGIGSMVDADMEEASARLQALQVQQQLGIQALSIANQAPQNVLSLFR